MTIPRAPGRLGPSGRRLWRAVQAEYELEEHEGGLLLEMCRSRDTLDRLAALVAEEGDTVPYDDSGDGPHQAAPGARRDLHNIDAIVSPTRSEIGCCLTPTLGKLTG